MVRLVFRPYSQHRYEPPPEFPLALPYSSIVHHLSGLSTTAPGKIFCQRRNTSSIWQQIFWIIIRFHYASRFWHPSTRSSAKLLGPCFKTGRIACISWDPHLSGALTITLCIQDPERNSHLNIAVGLSTHTRKNVLNNPRPTLMQFASPLAVSDTFHPLFKVFFIFPSRYLFAIGLPLVFRLRWSLPPIRAAFSSYPTRLKQCRTRNSCECWTGLSPSPVHIFMWLTFTEHSTLLRLQLPEGIFISVSSRFARRYWGNPS